MSATASPVTSFATRLLALMVMLSVALLWLPKGIERSAETRSFGLPATQAAQDKGQAPRGAILIKRAGDDRAPGLPPLLFEPAFRLVTGQGAATQADLIRPLAPCPRAAPCGSRTARAPPRLAA